MVSAKVWESLNSALHVYVHETVEKHTRLSGLSGLAPVWKVQCLAHAVFCFVPLGPRPMSISSESWRMTEKHGEIKEETFRNHLSHRHTPLKLSAAASTRHSGHSPLLLGRSSLPLASLQTPKMPRGSFHQALWPQAYAPKTLRGSFHQALKPQHARTTFGSWDVKKVHAVVARSTFRSQNGESTRGSDHFWRFRCRFAWQAQGIVHLVKSEQNETVL